MRAVQRWLSTHSQWLFIFDQAVLPEAEPSTWTQYDRLIPHALVCVNYTVNSEQSHLELASLLFKTANYLLERVHHAEAESLFRRALHMTRERYLNLLQDMGR